MNAIAYRDQCAAQQARPASSRGPDGSEHLLQLDALRAFAVLAVMYFHFYEGGAASALPWGAWGVQLFFVLSGFLITGILLKHRTPHPSGGTRAHVLKQFYIRRTLRIFPLFYFVILLMALIDVHPVRATLGWHLAYASNFYFAWHGQWDGPISHLWSLAVEEQFYLVWPCLMLFVPDRWLLGSIAGAIASAAAYKIAGGALGVNPIALGTMAIGCLDSLGIGALLAFYRHRSPAHFAGLVRDRRYRLCGGMLLAVVALATRSGAHAHYLTVTVSLLTSLLFAFLVHSAAVGFGGAMGRLLESGPLVYVGKISYGVYVYHNFMAVIVPVALRRLELPYPGDPLLRAGLLTAATLAVASVSWFLFERPVAKLKSRFGYTAPAVERLPSTTPIHA